MTNPLTGLETAYLTSKMPWKKCAINVSIQKHVILKKGGRIMFRLSKIVRIFVGLLLVTALVGCAAGSKSQSTGQYFDDSVITSKVKTLLLKDEKLKGFQIKVETFNGVVQLSGFVDNKQTIEKAGQIAKNVAGVQAVKNNLILK